MNYKQFLNRNMRTFFVTAAIPIFVFGMFSLLLTRNHITAQLEEINSVTQQQISKAYSNVLLDICTLDITLNTIPSFSVYLRTYLQDTNKKTLTDSSFYVSLLTSLLVTKTASNSITNSIYAYYPNTRGNFYTSAGMVENIANFHDSLWYEDCIRISSLDGIAKLWLAPHDIGLYQYDRTGVITYLQRMSSGHGVLICNFSVKQTEKYFANLLPDPSQGLIMTDQTGKLLCTAGNVSEGIVGSDCFLLTENEIQKFKKEGYYVSSQEVPQYNLCFYFLTGTSELYRLPNTLLVIIVTMLVACFVIALILSYRNTKKSQLFLDSILATFDAASKGEKLPQVPYDANDKYMSALTNVIQNFLKTDLLNVQLSEKMYQNRTLELTALQAQMNPHFLYNTLDTLYWRIIGLTKGPSKETEIIENLSDILRYALDNKVTQVKLCDELKNVEDYINIQKTRFGDNFQITWDISPDVNECYIIKLVFQPLIENCIQHAYKGKQLNIRITATLMDTDVRIVIADDGIGIAETEMADIQSKLKKEISEADHIGLFNTHKRLKLTYGSAYGLTIESKYGEGTVITLCLPYLTEPISH